MSKKDDSTTKSLAQRERVLKSCKMRMAFNVAWMLLFLGLSPVAFVQAWPVMPKIGLCALFLVGLFGFLGAYGDLCRQREKIAKLHEQRREA